MFIRKSKLESLEKRIRDLEYIVRYSTIVAGSKSGFANYNNTDIKEVVLLLLKHFNLKVDFTPENIALKKCSEIKTT